jgi:23S rRNA G2445 N2-methylase RlmL
MMDGDVLFKSDDRKILRQMYLSRLQNQVGNSLMHFGVEEDLFVERSLFHAYAAMLAYFFSPDMWIVRNAKGGIEPVRRQKMAFRVTAATAKRIKIACEKASTDCSDEGGESAETGIRKRK